MAYMTTFPDLEAKATVEDKEEKLYIISDEGEFIELTEWLEVNTDDI